MVGFPFYLLPIPEAPFILASLLSTSAIALLSWYITLRLPELSLVFVFAWSALLPWTLHMGASVYNPSYLFLGSTLFFIGLMESIPGFSLNRIPPGMSFALMGFGLFWDMQLHYSWVLLLPLLMLPLFLHWKSGLRQLYQPLLGFLMGSFFPLLFIMPTFLKYGFSRGSEAIGLAVAFNSDNFFSFFTILARYLSFACYEVPRFIGEHSRQRLDFLLKQVPWIALPGLFLMFLGWLQPVVLLLLGFKKDKKNIDSRKIGLLIFASFMLVWTAFCFTSKPPLAHMYFILAPLVIVYSFYIWARFDSDRLWRVFGLICVIASIWFQSGYLIEKLRTQSLYKDRATLVKAIQERNYHLVGERRSGSLF